MDARQNNAFVPAYVFKGSASGIFLKVLLSKSCLAHWNPPNRDERLDLVPRGKTNHHNGTLRWGPWAAGC